MRRQHARRAAATATVAAGSASGIVPFSAIVYRDQLRNNDWWSYNGYLQDSYSRGRIRLNGGLRYDWQQSKYLGGCVPANVVVPDLLPAQCEDETMTDAIERPRDPVVRQLVAAPVGHLRHLRQRQDAGARERVVLLRHEDHAGQLADRALHADDADVGQQPVERAVQHDRGRLMLERREPRRPGAAQRAGRHADARAAPATTSTPACSAPAGNIVDPSAKIGRTREAIVGMQHELIPNLAVGVDYIYRKYDRGTTTYTIGFQPGAPGYPLSQIYVPAAGGYTDPVTGLNAPYFVICDGCSRPSGLGSITLTNPDYQVYQGLDITATKRYSHKWQMQTALTHPDQPELLPGRLGDVHRSDRAGVPHRREHDSALEPEDERQLHAARGTSARRRTSTRSKGRAAPRRSTGRGTCTAASTPAAPRPRSARRRWSSSRAAPRGSIRSSCSTSARRRASASRADARSR